MFGLNQLKQKSKHFSSIICCFFHLHPSPKKVHPKSRDLAFRKQWISGRFHSFSTKIFLLGIHRAHPMPHKK